MSDLCWLTDAQMATRAPFVATSHGKASTTRSMTGGGLSGHEADQDTLG